MEQVPQTANARRNVNRSRYAQAQRHFLKRLARPRVRVALTAALCFVLAAAPALSAQTGVSRKRIPADPAAAALNDLLAAAQAAMDRKDYPVAAQAYLDYLAKKPDDATVHFNLGYVYTAMQSMGDAQSEYRKAISLDPKMVPAYLNLGLTLLASDPAAAVAPLQKLAELAPDEAHPKMLLGNALERSGKIAPAIAQFQAAEKLDGNDFDVRFSLGRALLSAGRAGDAEPHLRAALALRPDAAEVHLSLARCLAAQKKTEGSAAELAAYLDKNPTDVDVRIERASALDALALYDDALAELDRAAATQPEGLRALKLRARAYLNSKRYDDALPVLLKTAALAPQEPDIPVLLGEAYLAKKDYPAAARSLDAALRMNPGDNDVLAELVEAEYLGKNYEPAGAALDLLAKRKVLPAGSWFIRADCYDKLKQPADALDAYQRFLQLNKDETSDMYFAATARVRALLRQLRNKKR